MARKRQKGLDTPSVCQGNINIMLKKTCVGLKVLNQKLDKITNFLSWFISLSSELHRVDEGAGNIPYTRTHFANIPYKFTPIVLNISKP